MAAIRASTTIGFSRHAATPSLRARARVVLSPWPVIRTTGRWSAAPSAEARKSNPVVPVRGVDLDAALSPLLQ
jgi:hypothetical protein